MSLGDSSSYRTPWLVGWLVGLSAGLQKTTEQLNKTWIEDGSWPRTDPIHFWCGSRNYLVIFLKSPLRAIPFGVAVGAAVANTGLATWLPLAAWLLFKANNLIERILVLNNNYLPTTMSCTDLGENLLAGEQTLIQQCLPLSLFTFFSVLRQLGSFFFCSVVVPLLPVDSDRGKQCFILSFFPFRGDL